MALDYDEAAETYDNTRNFNDSIIGLFNEEVHFSESMNILDFGCGTGNYLNSIHGKFYSNCCGVEPSVGMFKKAVEKNPGLTIRAGDHARIPFDDDFFDFIYMTDVIHHIPDLEMLFGNLAAKLKKGGRICVVTESHEQIDTRWYNGYFKSLAGSEKKRYPDISEIVDAARNNGLHNDKNAIVKGGGENTVTDHFIRMVTEKNYSMFRLLDESEYNAGLAGLAADRGKPVDLGDHGETLIWLSK